MVRSPLVVSKGRWVTLLCQPLVDKPGQVPTVSSSHSVVENGEVGKVSSCIQVVHISPLLISQSLFHDSATLGTRAHLRVNNKLIVHYSSSGMA